MQRLRFIGRATVAGWNALVGLSNHRGAAILVLTVIGVAVWAVKLPHWWWGAIILAGLYALLFAEGAFRDLRELEERVSDAADLPPVVLLPQAREPAPELRILSLEERGGGGDYIDFAADIVNAGTKFCRATVEADVDGKSVRCGPSPVDLQPYAQPITARVFVPRPDLGTLIQAHNNEATLYGRALTVRVTADDLVATEEWREHVYSLEENSVRHDIQQREWRIGRGEATPADHEADMRAERLRAIDEQAPRRWSDV